MRWQPKTLNWREKLKKQNQINIRIQNKNHENDDQIKKKLQNHDYRSNDEIENKLKFNKRVKNQN